MSRQPPRCPFIATPWSFCRTICMLSGLCRKGTAATPRDGARSNSAFRGQSVADFPARQARLPNAKPAFGNGGSGNTRSETKRITGGTLNIAGAIPSNMDWCDRRRIGPFPRSTGRYAWAALPPSGVGTQKPAVSASRVGNLPTVWRGGERFEGTVGRTAHPTICRGAEQPRSGPRIDAFYWLASGKTRPYAAAIWVAVCTEGRSEGLGRDKATRTHVRSPPRMSAWRAGQINRLSSPAPRPSCNQPIAPDARPCHNMRQTRDKSRSNVPRPPDRGRPGL